MVVSTQVLAEVRPRENYNSYHWQTIHDLFHTNRPFMKIVALSPPIAMVAADVGSEFDEPGTCNRLTVPDAVHIATALVERVDTFLTFDGDRDNVRRRAGGLLRYDERITLRDHTLKIEAAEMPRGSQLRLDSPDSLLDQP